jgi:hypothetical protein
MALFGVPVKHRDASARHRGRARESEPHRCLDASGARIDLEALLIQRTEPDRQHDADDHERDHHLHQRERFPDVSSRTPVLP